MLCGIYKLTLLHNMNTGDGPFYVMETFPVPGFVIDEEGNPKSFLDSNEAIREAEDCQQGMVIVF